VGTSKGKTMAKTKKKPAAKKAPKKKISMEVDFSDDAYVKLAMAQELEVPVDDMEIEEDRGMTGFGEGTVYRVTAGRKEYLVADDEDAVEKLAVAVVLQDLEESPENFEQNFIASHIDMDRLRRDLYSDVYDSNFERLNDEAERKPMEFMKDNDIDIPEPTKAEVADYAEKMSNEEKSAEDITRELHEGDPDAEDKWITMGDEPEVPNKDIEEIADRETNEQLKDPMSYLSDIYSADEVVKKAIEIGGIDEKAAAGEAVDVDGPGHFLSSYDGNLHKGPGGIVYWRTN
jgi:hypothetical protein